VPSGVKVSVKLLNERPGLNVDIAPFNFQVPVKGVLFPACGKTTTATQKSSAID